MGYQTVFVIYFAVLFAVLIWFSVVVAVEVSKKVCHCGEKHGKKTKEGHEEEEVEEQDTAGTKAAPALSLERDACLDLSHRVRGGTEPEPEQAPVAPAPPLSEGCLKLVHQLFDALDVGADGFISEQEFLSNKAKRIRQPRIAHLQVADLKQMDKDEDGRISREEWTAGWAVIGADVSVEDFASELTEMLLMSEVAPGPEPEPEAEPEAGEQTAEPQPTVKERMTSREARRHARLTWKVATQKVKTVQEQHPEAFMPNTKIVFVIVLAIALGLVQPRASPSFKRPSAPNVLKDTYDHSCH
jgi:hypothetical protein